MKRDTINYFAVGGFVLAGLIALGAALLAISGRTGPEDDYFVRYRSVAGVRYGTPVYYQGYRIGQVSGIEPEHDATGTRYRVVLAVRSGWPIPRDSIASAIATGLLSDVSISISEGKSPQRLEPGGEIAGREGGDLFMAFNELAAEVQSLTRNSIRPLVEQLSATLGEGGPVVTDLHSLLVKLNDGADGLRKVVGPGNQREIAELLRHFNETSGNAAQLSAELLETRKQLDSVMEQLDAAGLNMREFSREIRANPNRLLSGTPPQDEVKR
jgi:phospholipid/cholesterol/gamma-HCH transport system substrate-binding protein